MVCRAFHDLTGQDAKEVAALMNVHGAAPGVGPLVELQIHDGEIRVTAHAAETFSTLAIKVNQQHKPHGVSLAITDRETGLMLVTERSENGRVIAYQLDPGGDDIREINPTNPAALGRKLKTMGDAVMLKLVKTDSARFS